MHSDSGLHDDIRAKLTALVESPPTPRRSLLETILEPHRELIMQAHAKGHNFRTITSALREAGLKASPETIRRYVQRITTDTTLNGKPKTRAPRRVAARKSPAKT